MKKIIGLMMGLGLACAANASVVAEYNFNSLGDGETATVTSDNLATSEKFAATSEDANVTASNIGVGSGLASITYVSNDTADYFQIAEGNGLSDGTDNNMAAAYTAGDYFEFTVTADTGYTLNLTSLTFDFARGGNGCNDYGVYTSVDNYASYVFGDDAATTDLADLETGDALETIDLSGESYQGLSTITFRIAMDDRQSNTPSSSSTIFDDITLNATVIPEPATIGMLGLGTLGLLAFRRRMN